MSGDTAILKNGRTASLTEAGWEVHRHTSDKKELIFLTIAELTHWGNTHDYYGKRLSKEKSDKTNKKL